MSGNKTQEKTEPEDKVLALNSVGNKQNKNGKFFKSECNKCGKYGHRASDFWVNINKVNDNRNNSKNNRKPLFNGEGGNCGKIGHMAVYCWSNNKDKYDDFDNLFVGAKFYGEVSEDYKEEYLE